MERGLIYYWTVFALIFLPWFPGLSRIEHDGVVEFTLSSPMTIILVGIGHFFAYFLQRYLGFTLTHTFTWGGNDTSLQRLISVLAKTPAFLRIRIRVVRRERLTQRSLLGPTRSRRTIRGLHRTFTARRFLWWPRTGALISRMRPTAWRPKVWIACTASRHTVREVQREPLPERHAVEVQNRDCHETLQSLHKVET